MKKDDDLMKAAYFIALGKYDKAYDALENRFNDIVLERIERNDFEGDYYDFIEFYKKEVRKYLDHNYDSELDWSISKLPNMEDVPEDETYSMVRRAIESWDKLIERSAENMLEDLSDSRR